MTIIRETNFSFPGQIDFFRGKVKDNYVIEINGRKYMFSVVTGRTSVFNQKLLEPIPYQGKMIARMSQMVSAAIKDIVNNWVISYPHSDVMFGHYLEIIPFEFIFRRYLTGSFYSKFYKKGNHNPWNIEIPDGMYKNKILPEIIFTPTHKSENDDPVTEREMLESPYINQIELAGVKACGINIFQKLSDIFASAGQILVDFKIEVGRDYKGDIMLADEPPTVHSARFWGQQNYQEFVDNHNVKINQLSKEELRQFVIELGFDPNSDVSESNPFPQITEDHAWSMFQVYKEQLLKYRGLFEPDNWSQEIIIGASEFDSQIYLNSMYETLCQQINLVKQEPFKPVL